MPPRASYCTKSNPRHIHRKRFGLPALAASVFALAACDPAESECAEGEVRLPGGCAPECGPGQEHVGLVCRDVCAEGEQRVAGECVSEFDVTGAPVRLNSVGFLPDRVKLASIPVEQEDADTHFVVRSNADGAEAYSGDGSPPMLDEDSGELVWIADYTEFSETGEYYLEVAGGARSPTFAIHPDAYRDVVRLAMMGLHGQRCGTEVTLEHNGWQFHHGACHLNDGSLEFVNGTRAIQPATRGWHDAGDYGKYVVNGAFSLGMLLKAWEHFQPRLEGLDLGIPEHGGPLPDFLAEAKWQLDWLLGMQFADGSVAHKLTPVNFALQVMPEGDGGERFLSGAGTVATADFAAVTAQAARIYEPYDAQLAATLLAAARLAWDYLLLHPDYEAANMSDFQQQQYQGGYSDDDDDRLWAAAELWETTSEAEFLTEVEGNVDRVGVDLSWDWNDQGNLGVFTYALSAREGRDETVLDRVRSNLLTVADRIVGNSGSSRYGRGLDAGSYYWGSNGTVARIVMNLQAAYLVSPDDAYLDAAVQQIDHLLGRNYFGRSMLTGIGHYPPLAPHHRPSQADGIPPPWPGLLVGGPNGHVSSWEDAYDSYTTNEIAINWITPMVYAVAGFGG